MARRQVTAEQQQSARRILLIVVLAIAGFAVLLRACGDDPKVDPVASAATTAVQQSTTTVAETSSTTPSSQSVQGQCLDDVNVDGRSLESTATVDLAGVGTQDTVTLYGPREDDARWLLVAESSTQQKTVRALDDLIGLGKLRVLGTSRLDAGPATDGQQVLFVEQGVAPHVSVVTLFSLSADGCELQTINESSNEPARFFVGRTQTAFVGVRCTPSIDLSQDLIGDSQRDPDAPVRPASSLLKQLTADGAKAAGATYDTTDLDRPLAEGRLTRSGQLVTTLDPAASASLIAEYEAVTCPGVTSPR